MSVGTNVGDIALWEVGSRERLVSRNFKVWDLSTCSMPFQVVSLASLMIFLDRNLLKCKACNFAMTEENTNYDQFRLLWSKIQVFLSTV